MKEVYGIGVGTARIIQTYPTANKPLTLDGEGGPDIVPSQTLVLDVTVRDTVLVKNLNIEYFQTSFTNRHVVDQRLERARNVTDEE